jgi:hypothetical protein
VPLPRLMAFGAARGYAPVPPEKGSFPLDHGGQCRPLMKGFLECLAENRAAHARCATLSKAYLACRMQHGLMAVEDLDELGYKYTVVIDEDKVAAADAAKKERKGFTGGLSLTETNPKA